MATTLTLPGDSRSVTVARPVPLFPTQLAGGPLPGLIKHQYDVSPDGQRFLMMVLAEDPSPPPITLILKVNSR
jgi:hypothetical protein